ncbi:MAG: carbon-nitrogen hydrolase family protein [Candidatus Saganbacteria bacterium]|nr:carbon-nitrogen hydrolase family protein [Candidatus Saganbacteria bacterium]
MRTGFRLAIYQGEDQVGSFAAIEHNLSKLEKILTIAKKRGAQLLGLPELYLTGYALSPKLVKELAQPINGPAISRARALAKKHKIALVFPYPEKAGRHYYDSIALIDKHGIILDNYRKTHLFGRSEKLNFSAGSKLSKISKINGFPVGMLNCYEAEFPELTRSLAIKGAKLIVIPTAADNYYILPNGKKTKVPYPDISKLLLPAHAFENHLFIAYCNRCGKEKVSNHTWHYRGNSVVVDPHGKIIAAAPPKETLLITDICPDDYGPTHPEGDYLKDRRPELYK